MAEALLNGIASTLVTAIDTAQTTISIASVDASKFPAGANYRIAVTDSINTELMLVTGGQGTATLTVQRAVEPYSGLQASFAFGIGAIVAQVLTQAGFAALIPLSYQQVSLGGNLSPAQSVWTNVLSLTLPAGVWNVRANVTAAPQTGTNPTQDVRIWDGTTVFASQEITCSVGFRCAFSIDAIIGPLATTTTITVQIQFYQGTGQVLSVTTTGTVINCTNFKAVKIG